MELAKPLARRLRLRASRSAYMVMATIWGSPAWVGILLFKVPGAVSFVAVGVIAIVLVFWWLRAFQIVLTTEAIEYQALWPGRQVLALADLDHARVESGLARDGFRSRPMIRLVLFPMSHSGQRIDINLKVFDPREIRELLQYLGVD